MASNVKEIVQSVKEPISEESSSSKPVEEGGPNLQLDEVTGERVSKSEREISRAQKGNRD